MIWQLKTRYRKIMPLVLAIVAESCSLRSNYQCWRFLCSSKLGSNTANVHMSIMEQALVPMYEAQVWCPVSLAPVYWTRVSKIQTYSFSPPSLPNTQKYLHCKLASIVGAFNLQEVWVFFNASSSIALFSFYNLQKRPSPWRMRDLFHSCHLAHHEIYIPMVSCLNFLRILLL